MATKDFRSAGSDAVETKDETLSQEEVEMIEFFMRKERQESNLAHAVKSLKESSFDRANKMPDPIDDPSFDFRENFDNFANFFSKLDLQTKYFRDRFNEQEEAFARITEALVSVQEYTYGLVELNQEFAHRLYKNSKDQLSLAGSDKTEQEGDNKPLKEYLIAISAGLDPKDISMNRYVPIRIFLNSGENSDGVRGAVASFAIAAGFVLDDEYLPQTGSWFQKIIGKSKDAITSKELFERLEKAERALELSKINKVQSEIDKNLGKAAASVIESLKEEDEAVIQLSSLLIVKRKNSNGKSTIETRQLSQKEIIYFEHNPQMIKNPGNVLEQLDSVKSTVELPLNRKSGP